MGDYMLYSVIIKNMVGIGKDEVINPENIAYVVTALLNNPEVPTYDDSPPKVSAGWLIYRKPVYVIDEKPGRVDRMLLIVKMPVATDGSEEWVYFVEASLGGNPIQVYANYYNLWPNSTGSSGSPYHRPEYYFLDNCSTFLPMVHPSRIEAAKVAYPYMVEALNTLQHPQE